MFIISNLACRAGEISSSERHVLLNFSCSGRLERERTFYQGVRDRQEKGQRSSRAKKI